MTVTCSQTQNQCRWECNESALTTHPYFSLNLLISVTYLTPLPATVFATFALNGGGITRVGALKMRDRKMEDQ